MTPHKKQSRTLLLPLFILIIAHLSLLNFVLTTGRSNVVDAHSPQVSLQQQQQWPSHQKRILVTGAAGFIGYHLTKQLLSMEGSNGVLVVGLDNFNDYYSVELKYMRANDLRNNFRIKVIDGDTCDEQLIDELFERYQFTHIVHLAAQAGVRYSLKNPKSYVTANVMCNVNLMEAIKKWNRDTKFIYASSSSVYGLNSIPFSESQTVDQATNVYGATKIAGEHLASVYNYLHGLQVIGLRFFTVYGDDGRPDMAVFGWTESMSKKQPIPLFFKDGVDITRDFTHVDDIVNGIIGVINWSSKRGEQLIDGKQDVASVRSQNKPEVFNLGNNKPESVLALVSYLSTEMGLNESSVAKKMIPLPDSDMVSTFADIDKASMLLDFKPRVSLRDGVKRFVQWYKSVFWPENLILASYLTEKGHHTDNTLKCNSFKLIADWYQSVHHLGLRAIIFHDNLNERFIARYTTHNVRFVKVPVGVRSNRDERFYHYLRYLQERVSLNAELAPKNVLLTDLFNTQLTANPFAQMKSASSDKIFVDGSSSDEKSQNTGQECRSSLPASQPSTTTQQFHPSLIGGNTKTVVQFLKRFTTEMSTTPVTATCSTQVFQSLVGAHEISVEVLKL